MIKNCVVCGSEFDARGKVCSGVCRTTHRRDSSYRRWLCNRERFNAQKRWRRATNPDAIREYERRWRAANPESTCGSRKRWRAANPDAVREYGRRSAARRRAANPDAAREYKVLYETRRSAAVAALRELGIQL